MQTLTEEEIARFTASAERLFSGEVDPCRMGEDEAYALLCDCARYAFYNGENQIQNVAFHGGNHWIAVEFCKNAALDLGVKDALECLLHSALYAVLKVLSEDGTVALLFGAA